MLPGILKHQAVLSMHCHCLALVLPEVQSAVSVQIKYPRESKHIDLCSAEQAKQLARECKRFIEQASTMSPCCGQTEGDSSTGLVQVSASVRPSRAPIFPKFCQETCVWLQSTLLVSSATPEQQSGPSKEVMCLAHS